MTQTRKTRWCPTLEKWHPMLQPMEPTDLPTPDNPEVALTHII